MNYGPITTEPDSHAQMDKALELGINFFDTADVYGWKRGEGITEKIIGNWFAQGNGRRDKTVIATKVFGDMGEDKNSERGLSALKIRNMCEHSLKRLQTDHIDLYQMHHVARDAAWDEIWQAFDTLVTQGKVIYVGSSNFAGWHIATANQVAKSRGSLGLVCEQSKYSLACRAVELEVAPACAHYGLGLIPWSPLDGGLLGGVLDGGVGGDGHRRKSEGMVKRIEGIRPQLQKWEGFCKELGEKPADVALAWTLHNPVVTAPIIGPRTSEQLVGSLKALEIKLSAEQLKQLDEIWPVAGIAAGKPSPEAYAW